MQVPIYVRALDLRHSAELKAAGADKVITATTEAGMALGSCMLRELGARPKELAGLTQAVRKQLDERSVHMRQQLANKSSSGGSDEAEPQVSDVFVLDHAAVSGSDQPGPTTVQSDGEKQRLGENSAAALGVQDAPLDEPAVSSKLTGNGSHQSADAGPSNDSEMAHDEALAHSDRANQQQDKPAESSDGSQVAVSRPANLDTQDRYKVRDGSESCPVDSRPSVSTATTTVSTMDD